MTAPATGRSRPAKKPKRTNQPLPTGAPRRIAVYVRRSTDDEHQPFSIDAQLAKLNSYIDSQPGWTLVATFSDDASGATTERPGLQAALNAAHAGRYDVLLVYRVDRFSRRLTDMMSLVEQLDTAEVAFCSATEHFDTSTPMGRMFLQLLGMFAEFERSTIIDRVINGLTAKAGKGKWTGGTRLTATSSTATTTGSPHTRKRLPSYARSSACTSPPGSAPAPSPTSSTPAACETAPANRGADTRSAASSPTASISARSTSATSSPPTPTPPSSTKRPSQPPSAFATPAATSRPARRQRLRLPLHRPDHLPTLRAQVHRHLGPWETRRYRYYTCFSRTRYGAAGCPAGRIDADDLDTAVLTAIAHTFTSRTDLLTDVVTRARQHHHDSHAHRRTELATVEAEIASARAAIDRYLTAFENGTMNDTTCAPRTAALEIKIIQLGARHAELIDILSAEPTTPSPDVLNALPRRIRDVIAAGTPVQRKELIEAMVAEIRIEGGTVYPIFRLPQDNENLADTISTREQEPPLRTMVRSVELKGLEP